MYIFGQLINSDLDKQILNDLFDVGDKKVAALGDISILSIIDTLDVIGQAWRQKTASSWYEKAFTIIQDESSFTDDMIKETLDIIPELLSKDVLLQRVKADFGNTECLDQFVSKKHFDGQYFCSSLGKVLHVCAGNVFLGCIDSLVMGLLTKNVSILKLSSKNQLFPKLFVESVLKIDTEKIISDKFAILSWKGGDSSIEAIVKKKVDAIVAWGGHEMIKNYSQDLPYGVKLIDFGPKISIQILSSKRSFREESLSDIANGIAEDVCRWDQAACANAQNLFIEKGVNKNELMKELNKSFSNYAISRGDISSDENVEIIKEKFRAEHSVMSTNVEYYQGEDFLLHFDEMSTLRNSPLNRTLLIKEYNDLDELGQMLKTYSCFLQTCGLGVSPTEFKEYTKKLSYSGIKRFANIGGMTAGKNGAPHDGKITLLELVNVISNEYEESIDEFSQRVIEDVPFYKNYKGKQFNEFPVISGKDLSENSLVTNKAFLNKNTQDGYIFSSGGTTGKPKFSFYSSDELDYVSELLAGSYTKLALKPGDVVANLFVAGNLWSSFTAVQNALIKCETIQLPIGGLVNIDDLISYFQYFSPKSVFGIPSMLADLAKQMKDKELQFGIDNIFFAGEQLHDDHKEIMREVWGIENFYSAGYASVDVGPIGYQTEDCQNGEHYLYDGLHLECINGEAVVSSKYRTQMPVLRYRTGDKIEILNDALSIGPVKFKLLGRADGQIQIWGCRFSFDDLTSTLVLVQGDDAEHQMFLAIKDGIEILTIRFSPETKPISEELFFQSFYSKCADIRQTQGLEFIKQHIFFEYVEFSRNNRTGKVSALIDQR